VALGSREVELGGARWCAATTRTSTWVPRRVTTLVLAAPWASTRSTKLIFTSASITGSGAWAATTMSTSPMVSGGQWVQGSFSICVRNCQG
jgi:hypothetical protein